MWWKNGMPLFSHRVQYVNELMQIAFGHVPQSGTKIIALHLPQRARKKDWFAKLRFALSFLPTGRQALKRTSELPSRNWILISKTLGKSWKISTFRREAPRSQSPQILILNSCGAFWTKFELFFKKIRIPIFSFWPPPRFRPQILKKFAFQNWKFFHSF